MLVIEHTVCRLYKKLLGSETCITVGNCCIVLHLEIDLLVTIELLVFKSFFFLYHTACRKCDSAMETVKSRLHVAPRWMRPTRVKLHKTVTFNH